MELAVLDWIQGHFRCGVLDGVMTLASRICDHGEVWILLAAVLLLFPKTRRAGLSVACGLVLELVFCNVLLKPLVGRARPFSAAGGMELLVPAPGDASFPSGHTASSFAAAWALREAGSPRWLWLPALALAVLIALSRLYLYVHWPSDVLGGALLGMAAGKLGAIAARNKAF